MRNSIKSQDKCCFNLVNSVAAVVLSIVSLAIGGCYEPTSDYMKEGLAYLEKGELSAAVISLKNAVQVDPKSLSARLALADALERSGDLQASEQQSRRALETGGDSNELIPRIAVLILDRAENAQLVREFSAMELKDPSADSDLKAIVSLAYLGLRQSKQASLHLSKVRVQTAAVSLAKAQIAFLEKNKEKAVVEMDEVLKGDTAPWWVVRAASRVFLANGDAPKALGAMKRAYDLAPMHRGVVGEYAEQLIAANRKEDARPLRDKLRKLAPGYYRTQYLEALFLLEEGKNDQAYATATKVLAVLPEHIPLQLLAANIELDRNELSSGENRVKKILSADPDSIEGLRLRASIEIRRGSVDAAVSTLNRAISRAPEDRNLLVMASSLSWSRGDKNKAIALLGSAAVQNPPRAELLARLAEMQQAMGQVEVATKTLENAISLAKKENERDSVFNSALRLKQFGKAKEMAQVEIGQRPKEPLPLMWMAAAVGSEGNENEALDYTKRALDLRPDFYPALNALANTAKTPERAKEYESRLIKAVDSGSSEPRVYMDRARQMMAAGATSQQVAELLDKGVGKIKTNIPLREMAIRQWIDVGQKEKALSLAKEGELALPDSGPMMALAASVQELVGEAVQASVKYGQLAERFPDRVDWNVKHAQLLLKEGKKDDAVRGLKRLINARPEEPAPYQILASVQAEQGLLKDAQVTAEMLRDKPGMKAAGLLLLGDVYAKADRRADALKAYSGASDAGAAEAAMMRKVVLLDRTGSGATASAELEKWLSGHTSSLPAFGLAAKRATARGDLAVAAQYLEHIVKFDPKNPVALNELAWAYVMAKDSRALSTASRGLELAPGNPVILDTLAQAQLNAGQKKEALETLRKANTIDPRLPVVRVHLAELMLDSGDKKSASTLVAGLVNKDLDGEGQKRLKSVKEKL